MVKDTLPVRINLIGSCCFIADRKTENVCGLPANTKKFLETLAGLPQTPKSFSRHLRDSRKHQKVLRDTCGTPANTKKFFETLAGLPQTPKSSSRHLRDSRKHQKVFRDTCGTPASLPAFALTFAGVPQVLRRTCWPLQHAINDILYMNKGISSFCRIHVVQHRYQAI